MSAVGRIWQTNARRGTSIAVTLRPGVFFPDWAAIRTPSAEEALTAILSNIRLLERWDGYGEEEDCVRQAIVRGLVSLGHAPDQVWLVQHTGLKRGRVAELIDRLVSRDLVVRDESTNAIIGAYPLTTRPTEHHVRLPRRMVYAMCAVDALGAGAMVGADVAIESRCRACGAAIRIATEQGGTALDRVAPSTTVVWTGIRYKNGCAATSICTTIAFFCTDAHLEEWRQVNHPDTKGFRLTPDEAMQVGRAVFAPVLKPAQGSKEERT
ncbi:MAG: alkylmercury lyase family protein [Rhodospirillales bacterium]